MFINFDFDPDKFNRYTFYRAIMENTAMVTYGHMQLVRESTGNIPKEVVFASGASKSELWCQILADVLGIPVNVPNVKEATALGAAIMAGHGRGPVPGYLRDREETCAYRAPLRAEYGKPRDLYEAL